MEMLKTSRRQRCSPDRYRNKLDDKVYMKELKKNQKVKTDPTIIPEAKRVYSLQREHCLLMH